MVSDRGEKTGLVAAIHHRQRAFLQLMYAVTLISTKFDVCVCVGVCMCERETGWGGDLPGGSSK